MLRNITYMHLILKKISVENWERPWEQKERYLMVFSFGNSNNLRSQITSYLK